MINEERVKKIYKIALYDQKEEKEHREAGLYYRSDYIGKEVLKSFFTGTIAYALMVVLWMMGNWSEVVRQINSLEIMDTLIVILGLYIGFILFYLVVTIVVYTFRYKESKKKVEEYVKNIKRVYQMYEREDKLKL